MTIDSRYFPEQYMTGEGFARYPFEFEVIDESYVEVFVGEGVSRTQLALNTDYTVELAAYRAPISKNGVVVLTTPVAAGQTLWIERKTDITREAAQDAVANQPMNVDALEFDMDKLTMIMQELEGHFCSCQECLAPDVVVEVYGDAVQILPVNGVYTISDSIASVELRAVIQAGTSPFNYQWSLRGTDLSGETSSSLTFTPGFATNGAEYGVVVGNTCGSRTDSVLLQFAVEGVPPDKSCDAIEIALIDAVENLWPMDDPQFTSAIPADWRRTKGTLTLTNNQNVGSPWVLEGGGVASWSVNSSLISDIELCNNDAPYVKHFYSGSNNTALSGFDTNTALGEHWVTFVVSDTEAMGITHDIDANFLFLRTGGDVVIGFNPRLTVNRDAVNDRFEFITSLSGGNPSVTFPWDSRTQIHVITIRVLDFVWVDQLNGRFALEMTYGIQVDGESEQLLTITGSEVVADGVQFSSYDWYRMFRGGWASWLGIGMNFNSDPHARVWQGVLANYPNI